MAIDDGGPAFPVAEIPSKQVGPNSVVVAVPGSDGMSLRDYFAAQVIVGVIGRFSEGPDAIARWAYEQADAMIEARNARQS